MEAIEISNRLTDLIEDVLDGDGNGDDFNELIEDLEEDGGFPQIKENVEEMKVTLMNGADQQTVVLLIDTIKLLEERYQPQQTE
jgi:hypothetical protein